MSKVNSKKADPPAITFSSNGGNLPPVEKKDKTSAIGILNTALHLADRISYYLSDPLIPESTKRGLSWATYLQQNHNRRSTVRFTLRGRLLTAKECADSIHIPYKTLMNKYYHKGKEATELYIQNKYKDRIKQLKGESSCT